MGDSGNSDLTPEAKIFRHLYYVTLARHLGLEAYSRFYSKDSDAIIDRWNEAAKLAQALEVNPRAYIAFLFEANVPAIPYTNVVTSEENLRQYSLHKKDPELHDLLLLWKFMLNRLSIELKFSDNLIEILCEPRNEFRPMFIKVIAEQCGFGAKVPDDVLVLANQEVELNPVYREIDIDSIAKELMNVIQH